MGQEWRGGYAPTLAGFMRSIALLEGASRVEEDVAGTLRVMAARAGGTAAARRLQLATQASAAAQHARALAQALRQLAEADAAKTRPELRPLAGTPFGDEALRSAFDQRRAHIDRRLAELRRVRPKPAGDHPAPRVRRDTQRCAREAQRHCQDAVAHLLQARQLAAEVLYRSARAHDRAAGANARSAGAGIGDVAEHNRMAAFHRAAAEADRQRAREARILAAQTLETNR